MPKYTGKGRGMNKDWDYHKQSRLRLDVWNGSVDKMLDELVGISNRRSFYYIANRTISLRLINICSEILKDAAKKCPYETGKLRESGRVWFKMGKGGGLGKAVAKVTDGKSEQPGVDIVKASMSKGTPLMKCEIRFARKVKGRDLAMWTHEEMGYYVKRPKSPGQKKKWFARKPGTGPKYLERAFKGKKLTVIAEVKKGLQEAVREYNRKHGTRARRRKA